jgi:hypothetical protein
MISVSLTQPQREELTTLSHQAIGRVAWRAQMVLLSHRGFSVPQIAAIQECGEDVVRTWLHRYQSKGVAGLEDEPRELSPTERIRLSGWIVDTGGQPIAALFGPCPDLLECLAAYRLRGLTLSPAPLPHVCPAPPRTAWAGEGFGLDWRLLASVIPRRRLALAALAAAEREAAPFALPPTLAFMNRTCTSCPSFARVSMRRPPGASTYAWHQGAPRLLWRVGCRQRSLALCRVCTPIGGAFCLFSSTARGRFPHRPARAGPGPCARAHGQGRPNLAETPTRASSCVSLPQYAAHELNPAERIS